MFVSALGFQRNTHSAAVNSTGMTNGVMRTATTASIATDIAAGWVCPNSSSDLAVFAAASGFLPMVYPTPMSRTGPIMNRHSAWKRRP